MASATQLATQGRYRPSDPVYSGPYAAQINAAGRTYDVDPWLLASVFKTESNFRPSADNGADRGIAQINRVAHPEVSDAQAFNPSFAIPWAARYLATLRRRAGGSVTGALRAYNTGSTAGSPKGTAYVDQVTAAYRDLRSQIARGAAAVGSAIGSLIYPLGVKGSIIGRPYQGSHRDFGNWESDNAYDVKVPAGTPVYAVTDGVIGPQIGSLNSTNAQLAGKRLHLVTAGNEFYYAHLRDITVRAGQQVHAGDLLGHTGALDHLHIAQKQGWNPVYLNKTPPQSSGLASSVWSFLNKDPFTPWGSLGGLRAGATLLDQIPGVDSIPGVSTVTSLDAAVGRFFEDPAYPFLWLLFMLIGFGLIFIGITRLFPNVPRPSLPTVVPVPL